MSELFPDAAPMYQVMPMRAFDVGDPGGSSCGSESGDEDAAAAGGLALGLGGAGDSEDGDCWDGEAAAGGVGYSDDGELWDDEGGAW